MLHRTGRGGATLRAAGSRPSHAVLGHRHAETVEKRHRITLDPSVGVGAALGDDRQHDPSSFVAKRAGRRDHDTFGNPDVVQPGRARP
jgi:hypothetical protein